MNKASMSKTTKIDWVPYSLIFLMVLFHSINNYFILRASGYIATPDDLSYFCTVKAWINICGEGRGAKHLFNYMFTFGKPPLFLIAAVPSVLLGCSMKAAAMTNIVFLAVTLVALYKIGQRLYGTATGILAAFLFSMMPGSFAMSRVFFIECALTAMVMVSCYFMVRNDFKRTSFAAVYGIVIGLGLLTKQPYAVFIVPLLMYSATHNEITDRKVAFNFLVMLAIGAALASSWYLGADWNFIRFCVGKRAINNYAGFYGESLFLRQLYPVFFVLFCVSLVRHTVRQRTPFAWFIVAWLIVFTFSPNKVDRFILPVLPFIALITAETVVSYRSALRWSIPVLVVFSVAQYYLISYCPDRLRPDRNLDHRSLHSLFSQPIDPNYTDYGLYYYNRELYEVSPETVTGLLNIIREHAGNDRPVQILYMGMFWGEFQYQILRQDLPFRMRKTTDLSNRPEEGPPELLDVGEYEFIVIEERHNIEDRFHVDKTRLQLVHSALVRGASITVYRNPNVQKRKNAAPRPHDIALAGACDFALM